MANLHMEQVYNFDTAADSGNAKRKSLLVSLMAAVLVTLGVLLHTVSMATPYLAKFHTLSPSHSNSLYTFNSNKHQQKATDIDTSPVLSILIKGDTLTHLHFGLWDLCLTTNTHEACVKWGGETDVDSKPRAVISLKAPGWLRGAQATAVLGILLAGATNVLAIFSLYVHKSRDDSQRLLLLPNAICVGSLLAGTMVFVCDVIVAFKFRDVPQHVTSPKMSIVHSLAWSFVLDIMSVLCLWLAGLLAIWGRRKSAVLDA